MMTGLARGTSSGDALGRKFTEDTKEGSRKVKAALATRDVIRCLLLLDKDSTPLRRTL